MNSSNDGGAVKPPKSPPKISPAINVNSGPSRDNSDKGEASGTSNRDGRNENRVSANKKNKPGKHSTNGARSKYSRRPVSRYAALDLGTNNCRLLIASPRGKSMRIVDAFSRIVRLGENLSRTGKLSDAAMDRTIEVLSVCAEKIRYRGVSHMRLVATQACRGAENGKSFLDRVKSETGLSLEIINTQEEARLAMLGCKDLFDSAAKAVLVFDIGGGSTEISWIRLKPNKNLQGRSDSEEAIPESEIVAWSSLPFGVVSLAEHWDGREINRKTYDAIVAQVREAVRAIGDEANLKGIFESGQAHLLGTSGTVTSIAGVHLKLERYRRMDVDGLWLSAECISEVSEELRAMNFETRANQPCIGRERADLVVCGCAILEAIMMEWPSDRVRVADRGLREGMLIELGERDRKDRQNSRRQKRKR